MNVLIAIRDLEPSQIHRLHWVSSNLHRENIAGQLRRRDMHATADYLIATLPSGHSVGKIGIDYERYRDAGFLWQLYVDEPFRSCGIGTALIDAAEARIALRCHREAIIAVETSNTRAHALYQRLGYIPFSSCVESWDREFTNGSGTYRYRATLTVMQKTFNTPEDQV